MKFLVATTLVVVTVVTAESPIRPLQKQTAPTPYQPRGWRPNGPTFSATLKLQKQEEAPPEPFPSYGPPPSVSYGPPQGEATTTEQPTTTENEVEATTLEPQAESLEFGAHDQTVKKAKLEKEPVNAPGPVYVLLPQGQTLLYASSSSAVRAAPLRDEKSPDQDVELVKEEPKLAPVQAIPALAKIQAPLLLAKYEQVPQFIQLQQVQAVPVAQYASSVSQASVYTPYSASYVQVYQ